MIHDLFVAGLPFGGLIGATALLIVNWFVVRFLYTHPAFARLVEGDPDLLIRNGKILPSRLKKELITHEELEAAARRQGIDGLHKVESCRLEIGGALTFVPKEPSDDEKRHGEIVKHLQSLRESHDDLIDRVSRIERL